MEDKIRRLCLELLAKKGDEEVRPILAELREALHLHIERMRERFGAYPFLVERRTRNDSPPVNKQDVNKQDQDDKEDGPNETRPRDTGI